MKAKSKIIVSAEHARQRVLELTAIPMLTLVEEASLQILAPISFGRSELTMVSWQECWKAVLNKSGLDAALYSEKRKGQPSHESLIDSTDLLYKALRSSSMRFYGENRGDELNERAFQTLNMTRQRPFGGYTLESMLPSEIVYKLVKHYTAEYLGHPSSIGYAVMSQDRSEACFGTENDQMMFHEMTIKVLEWSLEGERNPMNVYIMQFFEQMLKGSITYLVSNEEKCGTFLNKLGGDELVDRIKAVFASHRNAYNESYAKKIPIPYKFGGSTTSLVCANVDNMQYDVILKELREYVGSCWGIY